MPRSLPLRRVFESQLFDIDECEDDDNATLVISNSLKNDEGASKKLSSDFYVNDEIESEKQSNQHQHRKVQQICLDERSQVDALDSVEPNCWWENMATSADTKTQTLTQPLQLVHTNFILNTILNEDEDIKGSSITEASTKAQSPTVSKVVTVAELQQDVSTQIEGDDIGRDGDNEMDFMEEEKEKENFDVDVVEEANGQEREGTSLELLLGDGNDWPEDDEDRDDTAECDEPKRQLRRVELWKAMVRKQQQEKQQKRKGEYRVATIRAGPLTRTVLQLIRKQDSTAAISKFQNVVSLQIPPNGQQDRDEPQQQRLLLGTVWGIDVFELMTEATTGSPQRLESEMKTISTAVIKKISKNIEKNNNNIENDEQKQRIEDEHNFMNENEGENEVLAHQKQHPTPVTLEKGEKEQASGDNRTNRRTLLLVRHGLKLPTDFPYLFTVQLS